MRRASSQSTPTDDIVVVPRSTLEVRDYRPCNRHQEEEVSEEDERLTGKTAEAVLRTFGQLFPFKDV